MFTILKVEQQPVLEFGIAERKAVIFMFLRPGMELTQFTDPCLPRARLRLDSPVGEGSPWLAEPCQIKENPSANQWLGDGLFCYLMEGKPTFRKTAPKPALLVIP